MNIKKLLMLILLLCACQVTVGAESEEVAEDISAGPIWNNDDAKTKCPVTCSAQERTWNGQWTTPQETWGKDSVCGCIHWNYEDTDQWGDYFELCQSGGEQSPIDINVQKAQDVKLPILGFSYKAEAREVIYNGHTLEVEYEKWAESHIVVDNKQYYLQQFYFHTPSENQVNGESYAMEGHFVHKSEDGKLAVVAVMFKEGAENTNLKAIWDSISKLKTPKDTQENEPTPVHASLESDFNALSLFPKNFNDPDSYYRFNGSLTTPPCSSNVTWLVMKTPVTVSEVQVKALKELLGHSNNRPIQESGAKIQK